jgi:hypothetical protein
MRINCTECGKPAIGPLPDVLCYVRAMVICPECLEKVPDEICNEFLEALKKANERKEG